METYSVDKYKGYIIGIEIEYIAGYSKCYATIIKNGTNIHNIDGFNPGKLLDAAKQWVDDEEFEA